MYSYSLIDGGSLHVPFLWTVLYMNVPNVLPIYTENAAPNLCSQLLYIRLSEWLVLLSLFLIFKMPDNIVKAIVHVFFADNLRDEVVKRIGKFHLPSGL